MKLFRLWNAGACAALLSLAVSTHAADLTASGTVLGTDGKPLSGVTVSLALAKASATTDASGAWSLDGATAGIESRAVLPVANGRLVLENGRLSVRFDGRDVSGRGMGRIVATPRTLTGAARAAGVPDTLLYTWDGKIRLRDTISASKTEMVRTLDTTLNPYIVHGYLTDERDGQTYRTVRIGTQVWMAQNLNYEGEGSLGKCFVTSEQLCSVYGRLYTWAEVMKSSESSAATPSGIQGICPVGWHVPSNSEWSLMTGRITDVRNAGAKLKSTSLWDTQNGVDEYGFHGLPSGVCNSGFMCYDLGKRSSWWSSTLHGTESVWGMGLQVNTGIGDYAGDFIFSLNIGRDTWASLRCLRD